MAAWQAVGWSARSQTAGQCRGLLRFVWLVGLACDRMRKVFTFVVFGCIKRFGAYSSIGVSTHRTGILKFCSVVYKTIETPRET